MYVFILVSLSITYFIYNMHLHLYIVFHLQQNVTQIKNSRENCETFNLNFYKIITTKFFFFQIFNIRLHTSICCGTVVGTEITLYRRFQGEPEKRKI